MISQRIKTLIELFETSRNEIGFPTNKFAPDADVNIYFSYLLDALANDRYLSTIKPYFVKTIQDLNNLLFQMKVNDSFLKYFIFKVNAEDAFIEASLYQNERMNDHNALLEYSKFCYQKAYVYGKSPDNRIVFMKINEHIVSYSNALEQMKNKYFLFCYSDDIEFCKFIASLKVDEKLHQYDKKLNQCLDLATKLNNEFTKEKFNAHVDEINNLIDELKALDNKFDFKKLKKTGE